MRDDAVRIILKMLTLGQDPNHLWIIEYISVLLCILTECSFSIPGIYLLTHNVNFSTFVEYFTVFSVLQIASVGFFMIGRHLSKLQETLSFVCDISKQLNIQNPSFEKNNLKRARSYAAFSIGAFIGILCVYVLSTPFVIDDGFSDVWYNTSKKCFGGPDSIHIFFAVLYLITGSYATVFPMVYIIYYTFHIQFQLMWLSMYIKENLHKKCDNQSVENEEIQNSIHKHLINVVKYRLRFKGAFDTNRVVQNIGIFLLCFAGTLISVTCVYNLKNKTNQGKSIKTYFTIIFTLTVLAVITLCIQTITDESLKMRDILYECPWMYWNMRNRKVLLLITTNSMKPWEMTFYNLWIVNYAFVTKAAKFVYSTGALLSNLE